jgi:cardiolipin synthase|tara:strand:+ start:4690 stop:5220 length:531 start_codon:yes stop_codon:yes gene_type:complete
LKFKDLFLLPNLITLSRLIIVIYLFTTFYPYEFNYITLIILIAVIGLSDSLDGIVARRFNLVSKLGIVLDPFTDRVVFLLLLIWIRELIPLYFLYGIIIRETLILIGSVYVLITQKTVKVSNKGKVSTVLVFITICLYVLNTATTVPFLNSVTILIVLFYFYVAIEYLYNLIYKHG